MSRPQLPNFQNRPNVNVPGPSRNSTSKGRQSAQEPATKRKPDWNDIFDTTFKIPKQTKNREAKGPAYERTSNSIILYDPPINEKYHPVKNPNGFVDVIVSPDIQNSRDGKFPLKPEQVEGLKFLWKSFSTKHGVILGHDMGLGKTRTAIAFLYTILEQSEKSRGHSAPSAKKIIILAPKHAIAATWEEELEKWCPSKLKVNHQSLYSYTNKSDGVKMINEFSKTCSNVHILLLSYDTFISKKYLPYFCNYKNNIVDVVICDEAHLLKNNLTQRSQNLQSFKPKLWIGLTGTPFNNTFEEFCNLVSFFRPGVLGSNYKQTYCRPIQNCLKKFKQLDSETTKLLTKLKNAVSTVIQYKNSLKIDVDKHELIVCVGLKGKTKEQDNESMEMQHTLYEALTTHFEIMTEENTSPLHFYQKLDMLKKLCIHPEYAYSTFEHHPCLADVARIYQQNFQEVSNSSGFNEGIYWLLFSGKLVLLFNMLKAIKEKSPDEKAIVVSYSTEILDYISKICKSELAERLGFHALKLLRYDGGTSEKERTGVLKKFERNNDHFLLLLSGKAAGTALNLTRGNHMFLLDPDWNPSNDKQVLARIYRHGQTRTVYTYRFLSTGTIEESIFLGQLSKEEIDAYFKEDVNNKKLRSFAEKDLLVYHPNTKSYLKDKLAQLCQETKIEHILECDNDDLSNPGNIELQYFAQELSCAKQYENKESVPDEELSILKNAWDHGITFAFHKCKLPNHSFETFDAGIQSMITADPLEVRVVMPGTSVLSKNLRKMTQ